MESMTVTATERTMYLPEILAHTRSVVAERKAAADLRAMERAAVEHEPRGFARALRAAAAMGPTIIAELKKASPSKGLIRAEFDAAGLAVEMEAGGAAVLSVLTDEMFFQGSLENLRRASAAVWLPCLRKDFMVDEFQMLEARANRADAILLIVAALTDAELKRLRASARSYGLDVLCEVHDAEELERACELADRLPKTAVRVAESGIHTQADMRRLSAAGFEAFLIGESLMRESKPGGALASLLRGSLKQANVY